MFLEYFTFIFGYFLIFSSIFNKISKGFYIFVISCIYIYVFYTYNIIEISESSLILTISLFISYLLIHYGKHGASFVFDTIFFILLLNYKFDAIPNIIKPFIVMLSSFVIHLYFMKIIRFVCLCIGLVICMSYSDILTLLLVTPLLIKYIRK